MAITRRAVALCFISTLLLAAIASFAWACTGQSQIQVVPTLIVDARRAVTVQEGSGGQSFVPGLVEIRWGALDGPKLAEAAYVEGQRLSVEVTVPEAAPGVYYVLAVQGPTVARAAVELTAGPGSNGLQTSSSRVSADLWTAFEAGNSANEGFAAAGTEDSTGFSAGIGLLATGLLGTGAFFVVAVARKRGRRVKGH